jgi:hypothetical protein
VTSIFRFGHKVRGFNFQDYSREYNVHFLHDPRANRYQELVDNMRRNMARRPTWDKADELTVNGPVPLARNNIPDRVRRIDPLNRHHLAQPEQAPPPPREGEDRPVYQMQPPPVYEAPPPQEDGPPHEDDMEDSPLVIDEDELVAAWEAEEYEDTY